MTAGRKCAACLWVPIRLWALAGVGLACQRRTTSSVPLRFPFGQLVTATTTLKSHQELNNTLTSPPTNDIHLPTCEKHELLSSHLLPARLDSSASTMRFPASCFTTALLFAPAALANTEKIIFIAPSAITLPDAEPQLHALNLDTITYTHSNVRTSLAVAFRSEEAPRGLDSWYLLQGLNEGQRYEVRICWAAIVRLHTRPGNNASK